jgi:hypothetical protein
MSIAAVIKSFDLEFFRAVTHHNLRHSSAISSDQWEQAVAASCGARWIRGSNDLADVVHDSLGVSISVKTRYIEPAIKQKVPSRDFISHPDRYHFGGTRFSEGDLDNLHTVSGRCSIPGLDEQNSSPQDIGTAALARYHEFAQASLTKFNCGETLDVVVVHGESRDLSEYLLRIQFYTHQLNPIKEWRDIRFTGERTRYRGHRAQVMGFDLNGPHIGRISNLGRQQTCMLRFYRKTEALKILETSIPRPESPEFNIDYELKLIASSNRHSTGMGI